MNLTEWSLTWAEIDRLLSYMSIIMGLSYYIDVRYCPLSGIYDSVVFMIH